MIWCILILALILRLVNLNQSLWLDEAINVLAVNENTLGFLILEYPKLDFHPPGYFALLWFWVQIGGTGEVWIRFPSVAFGVAAVYLTYLISTRLFSKKIGLLSALLLSVNPLHIYYSQEARMYSFALFAVLLNLHYFLKLLRLSGKISIGFGLSLILLFSSDYLPYFIIPAQAVVIFLRKSKAVLWSYVKSASPAIFVLVTWLLVLIPQLMSGLSSAENVPGWKSVVGEFSIKVLALTWVKFIIGRINYPDKVMYTIALIVPSTFYILAILRAVLTRSEKTRMLLILSVIPLILAWLVSALLPIFSYFRMIYILPMFVMLVVCGLSLYSKWIRLLLLIGIIVVSLSSVTAYYFYPQFQREKWREAVSFLQDHSKGDNVIYESNGPFAPVRYYAGNYGVGGLKTFPATRQSDIVEISSLTSDNRIYLVEYLVEISDPQRLLTKRLTESGYHRSEAYNFDGVGFIHKYVKN